MRKYVVMNILFALLLLQACESVHQVPKEIEIIPVITVYSGRDNSIPVRDLFYYSDSQRVMFGNSPSVKTWLDSLHQTLIIHPDSGMYGMTSLPFNCGGINYDLLLKIVKKQIVPFSFRLQIPAEFVSLFGSFNAWDRQSLPMTDVAGNGIYSVNVEFDAGRYEYKFYVDGEEYLDANNPVFMPNGLGGFNSILNIEPLYTGNQPFITAGNVVEGKEERSLFHFIISGKMTDKKVSRQNIIAFYDNHRIAEPFIWTDDNGLTIALSWRELEKEGLHRVRVVVSSDLFLSNVYELILENGKLLPLRNERKTWNDAIIYSLMLDRFYDGHPDNNHPVKQVELEKRANFNGGDLAGLKEKIETGYFNHLGVNTLWISPFYKTTNKAFPETPEPHRYFTGYHGYWPVEPRSVEPRFGSSDLLMATVEKAHENNISVLMDFVSNHVHQEHPYFQEHPEWFGQLILPDGRKNLRLWDEQRLTTWFDPYLPSYDLLGNPTAMDTLVSDAVWWMKTYHFDGFRHDAVKHVPNEFWRALTHRLKSEFPDRNIYQIGETFGDYDLVKSYVNNGQLSAQFNFNLYWPARYTFATDSADFNDLASEMDRSLAIYGQLHQMGNVMDSHDQPRFAAYLDGDLRWDENTAEAGWERDIQIDHPKTYDKIKLYMTYLLTTPGIPVIYYGDEIGMTGAADPDNRRMMLWGKNITETQKELRRFITQLIALRNNHSALRYGDYRTLFTDKNTYVYLREDFNERLLIVIYRGKKAKNLKVELPNNLTVNQVRFLLNNTAATVDNQYITINTSPYASYVIHIK